MGLFTRRAQPEAPAVSPEIGDPLLSALLKPDAISRERAMEVPAFAACVDTIAETVASLPVRLYRRDGDTVAAVDDARARMLNGDTGDALNAHATKAAMVRDYYCGKGGFAYVARVGNEVAGLHYVDPGHIGFEANADPIFKRHRVLVDGRGFEPWQFVRLLRQTKDGMRGVSMVEQGASVLGVAWETLQFERAQVQRGGSKRGFLKSAKRLTDDLLAKLRTAFHRLYSDATQNFVVLNDGVEFQEASETSLEMQLTENKTANSRDVYAMFKVPPAIIQGGASENDRDNFVRYCLMPLLDDFRTALNAALLLETEKASYYFDFDLTEFSKANMRDRWEAWAVAKDKGLVQVDEFRAAENMAPLGMDYVNMGLNDVLFDVAKKQLIIPNMGTVIDLETMDVLSNQNTSIAPKGAAPQAADKAEGGDKDESDPAKR